MPKRVDHDERRAHIAAAAVDIIGEYGLDAVKLTQIARASGVTTGAVTHYFPDKDAVLLAALETVCGRLFARIEHFSGEEELAEVLPLDRASLREWRVWLAFWGRAAFVPRLREVHQGYYRAFERGLAGHLPGGDDDDSARQLTAAAVMAAIDGIGTRVCLEPELWPPARQRAVLERLLNPLLSTLPLQGKAHAHARPSAPRL